MTINVNLADGRKGILTDEHSRSSYGQMVLVVAGEVYDPGDSKFRTVPAYAPAILGLVDQLSDLHLDLNPEMPADSDPFSDGPTSGNHEIYLWNRSLPKAVTSARLTVG